MASYVRHREGWRAHVYVKGKRDSQVFRTRRQAEAWAVAREKELEGESAGGKLFSAAAEQWLKWKLPQLDNDDNVRTVENSIRDHVLPEIGSKRLNELKRRDFVAVVQKLSNAGKVETAQRVGQRINAILNYAIDCGDIESHLASGLSRVLPDRQVKHFPAIRPAELPELMRAINAYPEAITRQGLQLMAHTFLRTNSLIGARWAEIVDTEAWVVPAARMKKIRGKPRTAHVVPLSRQVRAILEELRPMTDESPYILASPSNSQASISNNTLLFALYRLGYKGRMTGHGWRTVASTILNESGLWNPDAIERQLSHKLAPTPDSKTQTRDEIREIYNQAEYLDERRRLMQWWSDHLEASCSVTQR